MPGLETWTLNRIMAILHSVLNNILKVPLSSCLEEQCKYGKLENFFFYIAVVTIIDPDLTAVSIKALHSSFHKS